MHHSNPVGVTKRPTHTNGMNGFAMIVVICLMAYMLLLMVALATFVTIETQIHQNVAAVEEARANAKFALGMAIGELQTHAGPDKRVTVPGDLFVPGEEDPRRNWIAVLDSHRRLDGQAPSHPTPESVFRRWLASTNADATEIDVPRSQTHELTMVGEGTVGPDKSHHVMAEIVPIPGEHGQNQGGYAWWISDESLKARINLIEPAPPSDRWEAQTRNRLFPTGGRGELNWITPLSKTPAMWKRVGSDRDFELLLASETLTEPLHPTPTGSDFHHFTYFSRGILSDARNGGLKGDLSLAFEMSDSAFRESTLAVGSGNLYDQNPDGTSIRLLFNYKGSESFWSGADAGIPGPSWDLLRNHYRRYLHLDNVANNPTLTSQGYLPLPNSMRERDSFGDMIGKANYRNQPNRIVPTDVALMPIITRFLLLLSVRIVDSGLPEPNEKAIQLVLDPVVVLWNPYNVALHSDPIVITNRELPFQLRINREGFTTTRVPLQQIVDPGAGNNRIFILTVGEEEGIHMEPGEVKLFSATESNVTPYSEVSANLTEGWNPGNGFIIDRPLYNTPSPDRLTGTIGNPTAGTQATRFRIELTPRSLYYLLYYRVQPGQFANRMRPESNNPVDVIDVFRWFDQEGFRIDMSFSYDPANPTSDPTRIWIPSQTEWFHFDALEESTYLAFNDTLPLAIYELSLKTADDSLRTPQMSAFNPTSGVTPAPGYVLKVLFPESELEASQQINFNPADNRGFYGPSHGPSGLTSLSILEIPTAPIHSIGELQHAPVSMLNHQPLQVIGYGYPSPFIPSHAIATELPHMRGPDKIHYDIAYLSNEALWDGYFFSSLTPHRTPWSPQNASARQVWRDAFDAERQGETGLSNPRLRIWQNSEHAENESQLLMFSSTGEIASDAWEKIAAYLMIDGAFNVNSTSAQAWRSVLSASWNRVMPVGKGTNPILRDNDGFVFSRFGLAADDETDSWQGYRVLSQAQLNQLADAIVDEVKSRGPFLSLADFVNRRPGNTTSEAASGTIQAALDRFPSLVHNGLDEAVPGSAAAHYPEPANISGKWVASGVPGIINQADILTPLAPIMTVRGDTFRIRSYGETRHPLTGSLMAQAWCEALVQRIPTPVEAHPDAPWNPSSTGIQTEGRKFVVLDFKWLSSDEI